MKSGRRSAPGESETLVERKKRAQRIVRILRRHYSHADCALVHNSAFELLIATILSAQSTDSTVNKVVPELFGMFPSAADLAQAPTAKVESIIRPTGFFRQKGRNIVGTARALLSDHGGEVPDSMEELIRLPGVARKTANVVLGTWFRKNVGVTVDTHVGRIATRLQLSWNQRDSKDAIRIEHDLMQVVSRRHWAFFSHALIWHGRSVCSARKPNCAECHLAEECPSAATAC